MIEIAIVATVVAFFLAIALIAVDRRHNVYLPIFDNPHLNQKQTESWQMPWGSVFIYDKKPAQPTERLPLVFIHSIGSSLYVWRYQLESISDRRVFAFDLPGFGRSDKNPQMDYSLDAHTQRILQIMDRAGIEQAILVGCSLGGALTLWLAEQYAERFPRSIAIAPAISPRILPLKTIDFEFISRWFQWRLPRRIVTHAMRKTFSNQELLTREIIDNYHLPYADQLALPAFIKTAAVFKDHRIFQQLPTLNNTSLILWGEKDRVTPLSQCLELQRQAPLLNWQTHSWGGHHLMEDDPAWVTEKILNFIDHSPH